VVAAVLMIAVAGLLAALAATTTNSSAPGTRSAAPSSTASPAAIAAWNTAAANALTLLGRQEPLMAQQEQQWESGAITTAAFVTDLQKTESVMAGAQTAVASLPPYPGQPAVVQMYQQSVALEVVVPQIQLSATTMVAGPLRQQVMLISDRVRELADRTFDQGRVLTAGGLVPSGVPAGSTVDLPLEVPDWTAEGLGAGPPLAAPPPAPDRFPPVRQGPRPTQSLAGWQAAVAGAGLPSPAVVQVAISDGRAGPLGTLAATLDRGAGGLAAQADPAVAGGRELSDRLRLSLLVEEEACRLGQARALGAATDAAPLMPVAAALLAGVPA
jgi:hypothetical protein